MLLPSTFVLLVLAKGQIAVCAPTEGPVQTAKVLITSDDDLKSTLIQKEKVSRNMAGDGVPTKSCSCNGHICSLANHAPATPKSATLPFNLDEVWAKLLNISIDHDFTGGAIATKAATGKKGPPPTPKTAPQTPTSKPVLYVPKKMLDTICADPGSPKNVISMDTVPDYPGEVLFLSFVHFL
ncbi:uncharacterized protein MELLADRAFT_105419 [Melampsora larici-populina 98AG31]|uniref:Secreted protein n=1 Tax=Melampsora larici-populina (strain 98AG31 / pathotype 3-4-7) TaxID=747676 RepID=F4RI29_MELLP|nr:uncharacterized protein MELLADRAFT_105419 [Melampsora larici-populina 98AG31]EGG07927.1 hypothetical protein MELLADRAFT_105419 [Melampsora larici-populina 98AG31]